MIAEIGAGSPDESHCFIEQAARPDGARIVRSAAHAFPLPPIHLADHAGRLLLLRGPAHPAGDEHLEPLASGARVGGDVER
jgi:hypothetical protein